MKPISRVVVLGANGAMGSGAAAMFARAGVPTTLLARTADKAEAGRARAQQLAKGGPCAPIDIGTYEADLATSVGEADLVFEAIVEDAATKHDMFAAIERIRAPDTVIATVSSGLSIAALGADLGHAFRRHFLGIHLFNPPTVLPACELIPSADTDPDVVGAVRDLLVATLERVVVDSADTPAFAGNRVGFKVLNEIAQLAEHHGVARMDRLFGAHTGRALPPLATIDLVGWDVHKAIVDNLWRNTSDHAHACFALPAYIDSGIAAGRLGRKTRDRGGFFRVEGKGPTARQFVLDPATGAHEPLADAPLPPVVELMVAALQTGRHGDALDAMCGAPGEDAELLRRVMLGYISYGLGLVGEVVERASDIDRIMGFGFNWAPPGMLVDAIGATRVLDLLDDAKLPVPVVVVDHARTGAPLWMGAEPARFFRA
jgi:3-hydroxyacyl-CoA dehydrogenase